MARSVPALARPSASLLALAMLTIGCSAPPDWYYHFNCHGDPACLGDNPTNGASGTLNEGPEQVNCTQLQQFSRRFWNMPPATDRCDQDPNGSADGPAQAPKLQSLTITPSAPVLPVGVTQQMTATAHYSDGSATDVTAQATWGLTYIQSAVSLLPGGVLHADAVGSNTLNASYGGLSASVTVTVLPAQLASIAISPSMPTVPLGTKLIFTAAAVYTDGSTVPLTNATWLSGTPAVATLAAGALAGAETATTLSEGTTVVSASWGGLTGSTTLTVGPVAVVSIAVLPTTPLVEAGFKVQLTAIASSSDGTTQDVTGQVTWATGSSAVATVAPGGLATGVAAGSTGVSATLGGVTGGNTLWVNGGTLQSIRISPALPSLAVGETLGFTAIGVFSDGVSMALAGVTWGSSATGVATVSGAGLATAVGNGTATVTAGAGGLTGSTTLTVGGTGTGWSVISPAPTTQPLAAVAWCGSRFVAVGAGGTILTSTDGLAWTAQSAGGVTAALSAVACAGSLAVVVGDVGTVLTSPDGSTWTARTSGTTAALLGVTWTGTRLVAVGAGGTVTTSADGITWAAPSSVSALGLNAVTWTGAQAVAVGGSAGLRSASGVVLTSPDGLTWTTTASPWAGLFGVTGAAGTLVVVGGTSSYNLSTHVSTSSAWVATSTDAATWTTRPAGPAFLRGVTSTGGLLAAVGDGGAILTSGDGTGWVPQASGTTAGLKGIAWSGARLVAVGDAGAVLVSP